MAKSLNIKHGIGKILTDQDIEILKKSSNLSEEEIRRTHTDFWGEFPDGKMNKEAFIKYYQLIKNDGEEPGKACDNAFNVFDENHDGVIGFAEFLFIIACGSNIDLATKYGYLFEIRDTSGNGQIDKNELVDFLTKVRALSDEEFGPDDKDPTEVASIIFSMLGSEPNGTLNKEQFVLGCINNPILAELFGDKKEE